MSDNERLMLGVVAYWLKDFHEFPPSQAFQAGQGR